jgi:hypothetical protein
MYNMFVALELLYGTRGEERKEKRMTDNNIIIHSFCEGRGYKISIENC